MSKKDVITVAEVINNDELTPDQMKALLREFQSLKAKIAKLPKEELKAMKKEIGGVSRRIISGELLNLKDELAPLIRKYRDHLKAEFEKSVTKEKPKGNKSISLKADIFTIAVIRSVK